MRIRPVTWDDRDEWLRMRLLLYPDSQASEVDTWFARADRGGSVDVGVAVLVAERTAGGLAGFAEIGLRSYAEGCRGSPVAFLEGWYVDADVRRQGVGRRLLAAVEDWARRQGLRELGSDTQIDNATSLRAHLALGFTEVERQICFYKRL
jgi:aminoglycoside 6'-N-acetyltransferase I